MATVVNPWIGFGRGHINLGIVVAAFFSGAALVQLRRAQGTLKHPMLIPVLWMFWTCLLSATVVLAMLGQGDAAAICNGVSAVASLFLALFRSWAFSLSLAKGHDFCRKIERLALWSLLPMAAMLAWRFTLVPAGNANAPRAAGLNFFGVVLSNTPVWQQVVLGLFVVNVAVVWLLCVVNIFRAWAFFGSVWRTKAYAPAQANR